ncbi:MAG: MATE family efflux transporter [Candidatus Izemoplasmatales bacterium]
MANDLTKGSILKKIVLVALPVLLSSIAQMAYNLTDMFWIGRVDLIGLSEQAAITGVGTGGYVTWFAFGMILVAKIGTSVKVSHATGAKNLADVERHAGAGLALALMLGIAVSLLVFLFRARIVGLFAIPDPVAAAYASTYVSICGGLLVFQFVSAGFAAVYEGLGKTSTNLAVMAVGLVMNIILDPILILVFRMGVAGAAIATVIAQGCTLTTYIVLYLAKTRRHVRIRPFPIEGSTVRAIVRIGFPAGLQSMFFTSISIVVARMILLNFGTDAMAASRVGSQIEQFTWMIGGGFQTAITVFVGQNFGAGQFSRIRRGAAGLTAILMTYAIAVAIVFALKAETLVRLFVDDPVTVIRSTEYLAIISFAQPFMMLESIGSGLFHGVGLSKIPSVSGIVGNFARIPLVQLLIPTMAQLGVWWALDISDALKGTVLLFAGVILIFRLESVHARREKRRVDPATAATAA